MSLVRLTIRPWELVDVSDRELAELERQGLIFTQLATLYANFYAYEGGPAADVAELTVTVTKDGQGEPLVGPTGDGIGHIAAGAYGYPWSEDDRDGPGDYLVEWDALDATQAPVYAAETVSLEA
ncbi:hypothetical protein [Streptomyces sp. MMBL 11-1]|uniref:hypothetical protein n=1 Tax=Streptomyces sp. MMBL 11-1 TaxID=3026420 RepID=UPI002362E0A2|nr:hypothetical protein [Streptomyces sp. MMBL 11-1]